MDTLLKAIGIVLDTHLCLDFQIDILLETT
jgi:hypothetical protein